MTKKKTTHFDTMVAAYLIDANKRDQHVGFIAQKFLGKHDLDLETNVGEETDSEKATAIGAKKALAIWEAKPVLEEKLEEEKLTKLFEEIEMPLIDVLKDMEEVGVSLDVEYLKTLSDKLSKELASLEKDIYKIAGEEFNINSPKQLQVILFEKLKLQTGKKTKTGYSTGVKVLEELSNVHPLPAKILDYRGAAKLKSTYVDALPNLVSQRDNRLHTNYNQTIASSGRLSSTNPNLQNIPIRSEMGRSIRKAFVPEKGYKLLAIDYSQVQLRLLAHFSKDPVLVETFKKNEDIHARTAGLIFGKEPSDISSHERRVAKTINFGVVYGMGPFKLSQELKISRYDAKSFIDQYFETYSSVAEYMKGLEEQAKQDGYLCTIAGRRRYFPELKSENRVIYEAGKREATNFPLQGSEADVMKIAMINIHHLLKKGNYKTRLLLQVHDELVFELWEDESEKLVPKLAKEMESVVEMSVPLKVDVGIGDNWLEAH